MQCDVIYCVTALINSLYLHVYSYALVSVAIHCSIQLGINDNVAIYYVATVAVKLCSYSNWLGVWTVSVIIGYEPAGLTVHPTPK